MGANLAFGASSKRQRGGARRGAATMHEGRGLLGRGTEIAMETAAVGRDRCKASGLNTMTRQLMTGSLLALISAALPMAVTAAAAQDVTAHCASVGNDDRVKPIPAALVPEARRLFGGRSDQPDAALQASTVFRCMTGQVWLCNHGANLTCAKGDVRRVSKGAIAWCRDHPGSVVVPMVATGHATIHTWTCVGSEARIASSEKPDARGFIAAQWTSLAR